MDEHLLIVDPIAHDAEDVASRLRAEGRRVSAVSTLTEALALVDAEEPDLVLVSLELPEQSGPRVVRVFKEHTARTPVVAMTSGPDPAAAVASMRAGAADYLGKPVAPDRLDQAVGRALREQRTERMLRETQEQVRDRYGFKDLLSRSPSMHRVFDQIRAVAPTDATVLVLGETGTGKELVARAIHDGSPREESAYVAVNCGAFAEGMLESELFGHEKGSFTGAVGRREGVFSLADGGTLFLDEIAETSLATQVNLLRVLEEMSFRRVGGEKEVRVDVRIVAATHADLEDRVRAGGFRSDLFFRLDVFPIHLPPLRDRREDIPLLLRHFLQGAAREYNLAVPTIAADARKWIRRCPWPGSVRQLRAMCERWVIVAQGRTLLKEMLPGGLLTTPAADAPATLSLDPEMPLAHQVDDLVAALERDYLAKQLQACGGHLGETARRSGITRRTLYTKLKRYGMDAASYRDERDVAGRGRAD